MKTPREVALRPLIAFIKSTKAGTAFLLLAMSLSMPLAGQVHFERKPDRIDVQVNGKPFTRLYFGKDVGKPYLHPLMTASGKAVTRGFPVEPLPGDATDRPHLRGIIIGVEQLKGPSGVQDFWENDPDPYYAPRHKGRIVVQEANGTDGADHGTLSVLTHWLNAEGDLWIIERRTITFYTKPADSRMFDIDLDMEAVQDVTFMDDKDVILSLRLGLPFDTHYDGRLVNANGGMNEQGARGQRSPWVDWVADLQGEKVGVAIFDHPSNKNYPNRWMVKDFGQVVVGPVGGRVFQEYLPAADPKVYRQDWSLPLKRGEKLKLRYRILIHPAEGPPAGKLLSDMEKLLDQAKRPLVDQRVYDAFNDWAGQKETGKGSGAQ